MRQLVLGRPPWQFWIEGGIGPRDASTTPIGPQRTAHLAAVEKTCTPSEIKEVNSCYSLCLKKLFVTNSEKKKTIFKYGMPTTRQQGWQFFVEPKQFKKTHWFWPTTLKNIWNWPTDMMVQFELNHKRILFEAPCRITHNVKRISLDTKICTIPEPDPKPELFGQTRPEPDPKSKSPTRQTLVKILKMKFEQALCKNSWYDLKKLLW